MSILLCVDIMTPDTIIYNSPNWNSETIDQSKKMLNKFYRVLKNTEQINVYAENLNKNVPESFKSSLCDDLNTSRAIADINEISKKLSKENNLENKAELKKSLLAAGSIMGILKCNPDDWLNFNKENQNIDKEKIEKLINDRNEARNRKDFSLADKLRLELSDMGIELEDTPKKTIWKIK